MLAPQHQQDTDGINELKNAQQAIVSVGSVKLQDTSAVVKLHGYLFNSVNFKWLQYILPHTELLIQDDYLIQDLSHLTLPLIFPCNVCGASRLLKSYSLCKKFV